VAAEEAAEAGVLPAALAAIQELLVLLVLAVAGIPMLIELALTLLTLVAEVVVRTQMVLQQLARVVLAVVALDIRMTTEIQPQALLVQQILVVVEAEGPMTAEKTVVLE